MGCDARRESCDADRSLRQPRVDKYTDEVGATPGRCHSDTEKNQGALSYAAPDLTPEQLREQASRHRQSAVQALESAMTVAEGYTDTPAPVIVGNIIEAAKLEIRAEAMICL